MSKKECAIVFGISNGYTFALANVLIGMIKHCDMFWDDIIVFHTDLSEESKNILNKILECKIVDFGRDIWCEKVFRAMPEKRFGIATFFRYGCFDLLSDYKKVIWSDVDILVQSDFSDILKYGDESGYAGVVVDYSLVAKCFTNPIRDYNMFMPICSAGLIVFSDILCKYENLCEWCCEQTLKYVKLLGQADQGILNLMLQEFSIQPEAMDRKYNCPQTFPDSKIPEKAALVHAFGVGKFWNNEEVGAEFPEWNENNKVFLDLRETGELTICDKALNRGKETALSVIMPISGEMPFPDEAIRSVLTQTFSHFELIVIIDFSDLQETIYKTLLKYDNNRIKIVKNSKRLGKAASLNIGLDKAVGEYVAIMEEDCISNHYRLQMQLEYLLAHPEIGICGTFAQSLARPITYNAPYPQLSTDPNIIQIELLHRCSMVHASLMMRKKDLTEYNLRYNEGEPDNAFNGGYQFLADASEFLKMANIPIRLLLYRTDSYDMKDLDTATTHDSFISVMEWQFEKYLQLRPTKDEMYLFSGRVSHALVSNNYAKQAYARSILEGFKQKIALANKTTGYYNHEKLEAYLRFSAPVIHKKSKISEGLRNSRLIHCLKPVLRPLCKKLKRI